MRAGRDIITVLLAVLLAADASAASPRLNETWRLTAHNAFWHGVEGANGDSFGSGPKQHLLDDLFIDRLRGVELDLHSGAGTWNVYHTTDQTATYSLCRTLEDCLRVLRAYHYAQPNHQVIFVHLEVKEIYEASDFFEHKSPDLLDTIVREELGDGSVDWVFGPKDYYDVWAPAACAAPLDRDDLRAAVRVCGWPTMEELEGRFIVTLHGAY
jgi:hypothetical protein